MPRPAAGSAGMADSPLNVYLRASSYFSPTPSTNCRRGAGTRSGRSSRSRYRCGSGARSGGHAVRHRFRRSRVASRRPSCRPASSSCSSSSLRAPISVQATPGSRRVETAVLTASASCSRASCSASSRRARFVSAPFAWPRRRSSGVSWWRGISVAVSGVQRARKPARPIGKRAGASSWTASPQSSTPTVPEHWRATRVRARQPPLPPRRTSPRPHSRHDS